MERTTPPADAGDGGGWQGSYTWSGTSFSAWRQPRPQQCRIREVAVGYAATACVMQLAPMVVGTGGVGVVAAASLLARGHRRRPLAERARAWVEAHLDDESLCVDAMAKALNMSRSSLHRNLVRCTGCAPGVFIRQVRLQRAHQLLRSGTRSVSDVAWSVGFVSLSGFSRAYRQKYGQPPSRAQRAHEVRSP